MHTHLVSLSRGFYLAGIVLALVLVIPVAWFPSPLIKVALFALCLLVSAVLFIAGGGMGELTRARGFWGAMLVALLPLSYLVSTYFSVDRSLAFTGFSIDQDTVIFMTLLFAAFMLSFAFFRTLRSMRLLLMVLFWSIIVAALFQFAVIVFGTSAIPFSTFTDRSVNLIGKWNDLGLLVGLLTLIIIANVELMATTLVRRIAAIVVCVVLAALLGIINFPVVWALVLAGALVLGLAKLLFERGEAHAGWHARLPWFAIAAVAVSILFLFFGSTLNTRLTSIFPVSSLEVRPSYASTLGIIDAARSGSFKRFVVGTGPNTFGELWLAHKPAEVNQSDFWSLDFNVGFSTFITALGSVGLLGIIAWLVPLLLLLAALVRAARLGALNREGRIAAAVASIASLYLLLSILFYVPSENLVILAFVLAGATFGYLWRQGQTAADPDDSPRRFGRILVFLAALVLLVLSAWTGIATSRRALAETYVGRGTDALSQGNITGALADGSRAESIDNTGDALRLLLSAGSSQIAQIGASTTTPATQLQQQFAAAVSSAIAVGQKAQALNPQDYRPTLALAQIYGYLASLNVQGAAQTTLSTYQSAFSQDPTNPTIPLDVARFAANQGDAAQTSASLSQALTLKPNYTDAILFAVQLYVAQNDIPNAISAATAAVQSAPGVAPLWFELGLLYYSNGDATHAAQALAQAVAIESDYANAKYFLGLSEYALGDTTDAIQQFKDLEQSNPGNTEVEAVLANMQAGKQPFDGIEPPPTPPQDRTAAPVSE